MADEKIVKVEGGTSVVPMGEVGILDIEPGRARTKLRAIKEFQAVVREVLIEDQDYGVIPGTAKPTLYKPGAEKITKLLNLYEEYEFIERVEDWDAPLFHYIVRCTLSDMASGVKVASGLGACNSRESRYRYRWVREDQLSAAEKAGAKKKGGKVTYFEPAFAIEKKETAGQYGKPIEHWAMFEEAIANGSARQVMKKTKAGKDMPGFEIEVDTTLYQVPNPDIFDLVNTMVKIGKKRAMVDAALSAGRLSELFTQDLEDFADVAGAGMVQEPAKQPAQNGAGRAKAEAEAKARAEYEASKKKPLGRPKDEFEDGNVSDDQDETNVPGGSGPQDAPWVLEVSTEVKKLVAMGITEEKVYIGINRNLAAGGMGIIAELRDLDAKMGARALAYLLKWRHALEAEEKARAEAEAADAKEGKRGKKA
jgi:hypothetical protein